MNQRFRNSVEDSRSYPGADVDSDHNMVAMKVQVKLKKLRRSKIRKKWNTELLKSSVGVREQFCRDIDEMIRQKHTWYDTVEDRRTVLKESVIKSAENNIGYRKGKVAKNPWITEKMIKKMDERRTWKN